MKEQKLVTIAIPCYKSAKTIEGVVNAIDEAFKTQSEYNYEVLLVNDGSPDNTFEVIHRICAQNEKVTGINLSKNFGQGSAKMAAVDYVKGEYLIYMDDDGQHPASGIFTMIEKINEGFDIVYADFEKKKHSAFKKITSKLHNWYLSKIGSKPKDINLSSFMGLSSFCIEALQTSGCPVVSMGAYLRKLTNKIVNVDMPHLKRKEGKSGYSFKRLFKLWRSSITSFNTQLLNYSMTIGIIVGTIGILSAIIIIIRKLINPHIAVGYASLMAGMLILSALIMFFISIASDYIGKIYLILCKLPPFKVREVINKQSIKTTKMIQEKGTNPFDNEEKDL
ncbi:MAG: glycosyltransferase family 2 protein [Clostridia bacterium]|nr:glycosyltransferase family 2 protein [Clostridia bacterium]